MTAENQDLVATEDQSENLAFALQQLIRWAARCYTLGARTMRAEDAEAESNVQALVESGAGHLECRIDFTSGAVEFYLHIDHAGEDARELRLFTQVHAPVPIAH